MKSKKRELIVEKNPDITKEEHSAKLALTPSISAASTIDIMRGRSFGGLDLTCLTKELSDQTSTLALGDMSRSESLLLAQAHTLDAIFHALCERSASNMGEYFDSMERYMRLALKAQSQCQTTLRTLNEMKSPKSVAFVKQANIAENQQVNNNGQGQSFDKPQTQKPEKKINELLELENEKWMDKGTQTAASQNNTDLEAMDAINRA